MQNPETSNIAEAKDYEIAAGGTGVMEGRYRAYPEYKDSGVEWLGKVPKHWKMCALKRVASLKSGDFIGASSIKEEGEYPVYGGNGLRGYTSQFTHNGQHPIIGRQGALCGNINYAEGRFWASEHAVVVTPIPQTQIIWLGELLRAMNLGQYSLSAAQPGLSVETISNLEIPHPNFEDQTQIANFLDHETAKIDTLIEKQQQLITLLQEKRQAVISHAVTKGLNPDASMKDSGVEWLGEVPEHWEVLPLKHIIKSQKGAVKAGPFGSHLKNSDMEGDDVKVITQQNVISRNFQIGSAMITSKKYKELSSFTINNGDVLITTRGTIGRTAIYKSKKKSILHPCLIRIQFDNKKISPEMAALIIQESGYILEQILINSNATTIEVIYSENLINTTICLPSSLTEQKSILDYIKIKKEYFDKIIEKAQRSINLMKERRTALISAAVTGKIDVRDWQPPTPSSSDEALQ